MMPIVYRILPEVRAVYVQCNGVVTLDEVLKYETEVATDPLFDPEFTEVIDMRRTDNLDLSYEQVKRVVDHERNHERYSGKRKTAFIAPRDLEYGLTRMYEMMADDGPMETKVFREVEKACGWAGVAAADLGIG